MKVRLLCSMAVADGTARNYGDVVDMPAGEAAEMIAAGLAASAHVVTLPPEPPAPAEQASQVEALPPDATPSTTAKPKRTRKK